MFRPSKIDGRCVDLRRPMIDVKLCCYNYTLAENIDGIVVYELRRGFAMNLRASNLSIFSIFLGGHAPRPP